MSSFTSTKDFVKNLDSKPPFNSNSGKTESDSKNKDGFMKSFIEEVKIIKLNFQIHNSKQVMPY